MGDNPVFFLTLSSYPVFFIQLLLGKPRSLLEFGSCIPPMEPWLSFAQWLLHGTVEASLS